MSEDAIAYFAAQLHAQFERGVDVDELCWQLKPESPNWMIRVLLHVGRGEFRDFGQVREVVGIIAKMSPLQRQIMSRMLVPGVFPETAAEAVTVRKCLTPEASANLDAKIKAAMQGPPPFDPEPRTPESISVERIKEAIAKIRNGLVVDENDFRLGLKMACEVLEIELGLKEAK